jgi:hypothetical protein
VRDGRRACEDAEGARRERRLIRHHAGVVDRTRGGEVRVAASRLHDRRRRRAVAHVERLAAGVAEDAERDEARVVDGRRAEEREERPRGVGDRVRAGRVAGEHDLAAEVEGRRERDARARRVDRREAQEVERTGVVGDARERVVGEGRVGARRRDRHGGGGARAREPARDRPPHRGRICHTADAVAQGRRAA